MKNLLILGAGAAGTMMASHMVKKLPKKEWSITIVDQSKEHYYQPGFIFLPFDTCTEADIVKPTNEQIPKGVTYINKGIDKVVAESNKVLLEDQQEVNYDLLIIATGCRIAPEETEGMKGSGWHKDVFDFYTFEGARNLRNHLREWKGGTMLVHITEMPIKCPVAPLEFAFLADTYFNKKGMRDKVKIKFVTPLSGAFTKPVATEKLGYLLKDKQIEIVPDFNIMKVDNENKKIIDYGGEEVDYDLLVTIPTNMGDDSMERSGLGDDLNYVGTHRSTLQSTEHENIFVIGDAANLPTSKAGSVAHFQSETLVDNILLYIAGKPLKEEFDGHANCYIETGNNKAMLIDFNYTQEPVEGKFPIPVLGPFPLLKESVINHWGKLAFRWIYWNMLLKGIPIPTVGRNMSTKGKKIKK